MTSTSPFQINLGIKLIIEKLSDVLSWTELQYYKKRVLDEIDRLEKLMYGTTVPEPVQDEIHGKLIPYLDNTVEKINTYLQDKHVDEKHLQVGMSFSDLTNRLNQINRCL